MTLEPQAVRVLAHIERFCREAPEKGTSIMDGLDDLSAVTRALQVFKKLVNDGYVEPVGEELLANPGCLQMRYVIYRLTDKGRRYLTEARLAPEE